MAETIEDIEMRERNRVDDALREQQAEEGETSYIDDNSVDRDRMVIIDTSIPNVRQHTRSMKRAFLEDKKDYITKNLKLSINKTDAKILYDNLVITRDGGATYKGVKVLVNIDGEVVYNPDLALKAAVDEFKGLINGLKAAHLNTADGYTEQQVGEQIGVEPHEVLTETTEEVLDRTKVRVGEEIQTRTDKIVTNLTGNELSEFRCSLRGNNIEILDTQAKEWRDLSEKTSDKAKKELYEAMAEVCELRADYIRLRNNQIPKSARVLEIMLEEIRKSDMTRFQRFRKWARENLGGISAVAISIGGIITTIVMGGRKVINQGANTLKELAKSLKNLAKKFGSVIGSILKLIGAVLTFGANGFTFLAENLWLLAILFASYILYNKRKNGNQKGNHE